MSRIDEKSPKHCAQKQELKFHFNKKLWIYFTTFCLTIFTFLVLVWFCLHPTKPQFSIKQADINQLNITGPPFSAIHITLISNNPNKRVGIYYDELFVSASYNGLMITHEASIHSFYQDHEESTPLSAVLVGNQQTVAAYLAYQIRHDKGNQKLALNFDVMGKLRWKVGNWVSRRYKVGVNCMSIVAYGDYHTTVSSDDDALSSTQGTVCSTTV